MQADLAPARTSVAMFKVAPCLAAVALITLPADIAAQDTPAAPAWDFVEFEVRSWGGTRSSWRILPNGGGSWTVAVAEAGQSPAMPAAQEWHEIEPEVANYTQLEAILDKLPDPAPDHQDCSNFMTDAAYGTLRLTKGATTTEIAWNSGCFDDDYVAFMGVLREADQHMQALGKAAPVSRIEPAAAN